MTGRAPEVPRLDHRIGLTLNRWILDPFLKPPRTVFLLGSMRSGTSLLTNILISNDGISGFGESHLIYDRLDRVKDLRYWIARYTRRYPGSETLLLDKILHTSYLPEAPSFLSQARPLLVFLLRDPAQTAPSLRKMYEKVEPDALDRINVWEILEQRYRDLASHCQSAPDDLPIFATSYEALVDDPESVLPALSGFLGLDSPLATNYDVPRWSGTWGLGDGSDKIKSGKIGAATKEGLDVPDDVARAYADLRTELQRRSNVALL